MGGGLATIRSPRRGEYPTPEASGEGGWFTPNGAEAAG